MSPNKHNAKAAYCDACERIAEILAEEEKCG
jgi:hypothetical protein